jgi:hypothetical protein
VRVEADAPPPAEVLAELHRWRDDIARLLAAPAPPLDPEGLPCGPCPTCANGRFWKDARLPCEGPGWRCEACHPPPPDLWRHACAVPVAAR